MDNRRNRVVMAIHDGKPLRDLASRLRDAVDTKFTASGYPEIRPSLRDSSELARDVLKCVRILRALARVRGQASYGIGEFSSDDEFDGLASRAVFNSARIAAGMGTLA